MKKFLFPLRRFLTLILFVPVLLYAQPNKPRPNIIIILADDLGWADLSCTGSTFYETPRLDELSAAGLRFTNAYAASPVCSPTRASLLTGQYPAKTGINDWIPGRQDNGGARKFEPFLGPPVAAQLALSSQTIGEYALANGYTTFYAGKWHLGEEAQYWPDKQGFQVNLGGWGKGAPTGKKNDSTGGFFTHYQNPVLPDGPPGEYLTDRLTDECIRFIRQKKDSPYLMIHAMYAVHNPMQAPRELIRKYTAKRDSMYGKGIRSFAEGEDWMKNETGWRTRLIQDHPVYAAMIENMDWNIGRIIKALQETMTLDQTLIIFTSDNGGLSTAEGSPTSNAPLRAGKGWLYEGGIRVPFLMYWPGHLPAGRVSDLPVHSMDIYPTLARLMQQQGQALPRTDGHDLLNMMAHEPAFANRTLYWYYPHYSNQGGRPGAAIRKGDYKLIYHYENRHTELFRLSTDPGEQSDISGQEPQMTRALKKKLLRWIRRNGTLHLDPNPGYRPDPVRE